MAGRSLVNTHSVSVFTGILLPMAEGGDCTLREAAVLGASLSLSLSLSMCVVCVWRACLPSCVCCVLCVCVCVCVCVRSSRELSVPMVNNFFLGRTRRRYCESDVHTSNSCQ